MAKHVRVRDTFPVPVLAGKTGIVLDDDGPGCEVRIDGLAGTFRFMDDDVEELED